MTVDFVVIGAGIVGLSTAWQLKKKYPDAHICLLDKEKAVAEHQTGRNSGVVHAGIYYEPKSLKAEFCRLGLKATKSFCAEHKLPYQQIGKLIVATNDIELSRLQALFQRSKDNAVEVSWKNVDELRDMEPNITGVAAIYSPNTAITDYVAISEKLKELFIGLGGEVAFNTELKELRETNKSIQITTSKRDISAQYLIACAGLQADRVAEMIIPSVNFQIVPFKGEYHLLDEKFNQLVTSMIYPVPDPSLPFLGVHITPKINGSIMIGPNAVQAFHREAYKNGHFSISDMTKMFGYSGYWRLIANYLKSGMDEMRDSFDLNHYMKRVQKYCPQLSAEDVSPYPYGIRAQAVLKDGSMVHDFLFAETARSFHVCNAPSPAATSAFPIGEYTVNKVSSRYEGIV